MEKLIETEIQNRRGRLLITSTLSIVQRETPVLTTPASTEPDMQDKVQKLTRAHLDRDVRLMHRAFRPREHESFWSPKAVDVKYQGVV